MGEGIAKRVLLLCIPITLRVDETRMFLSIQGNKLFLTPECTYNKR